MASWLEARIGDLILPEILRARAAEAEIGLRPELRLRARYLASEALARQYMATACPRQPISAEAVADAYQQLAVDGPQPWILVRHIYKRVTPAANHTQRSDARRQLEELVNSLADGASFIELARQHSDSATAADGGLIGRLSRQAPVEPKVLAAAWALDDGEYSGIVEVANGFHIVQREQSGTEPAPSLESTRPDLERRIAQAQREQCGRQIIAELMQATPTIVDREALHGDDPDRAVLTVGDASFSQHELRGLSADLQSLSLAPTPGESLRHLAESLLLASAAVAADEGAAERLAEAEFEALDQLVREAQWRNERRGLVSELPEPELRQVFDRQPQRFASDLELDVGMMILEAESAAGRRPVVEALLRVADEVHAGADFAQLASERSNHWSATEGGRLGMLPLPRLAVVLGSRGAAEAARLEIGDVSAPVLIREVPRPAYALVKLYDRQEPRARDFEQVRDQVIEAMARDRVRQLDQLVRARLLADAELKLSVTALERYLQATESPTAVNTSG